MFTQLNISMRRITDKCDLIHESGMVTDGNVDKRIDFHFNAMLDIVAEWRKNRSDDNDTNLLGNYSRPQMLLCLTICCV